MSEYYIPSTPGEAEFTEKRSRFLGHVRCIETEDEAKALIRSVFGQATIFKPVE